MSNEIFPVGTNVVLLRNNMKFTHGIITQIRSPIDDHDVMIYRVTTCDGAQLLFSFEEIANLNQHYIELGSWQNKKKSSQLEQT